MGDTYVISGLVQKRAEILGLAKDFEKRAKKLRADLHHIDAALRLFSSELDPETIKAIRPSKPRSGLFEQGEMSRRCREAIRKAAPEPVTTDSIVRQAMTDKGLDPQDEATRKDLTLRFLWSMQRMNVAGTIGKIGSGMNAVWMLPKQ
jgi:hypothetical protein